MFRTKFAVADVFAIVLVLLCAMLLFLQPWASHENGEVLIVTTPQGSEAYSLTQDREFSIASNDITLKITISDGCASVTESDCPDGICLSSDTISMRGETIVCAPAGVSITVKGGRGDVDFVAG